MDYLNVALPAVISLFALWLGNRLGESKTYRERAWERKAQAYSEILESLGFMSQFFDESFDDYLIHRERSEEYNRHKREQFQRSKAKFLATIYRESWLLSDKVELYIREIDAALNRNYDDFFEEIDASSFKCREAVRKITAFARSDLINRKGKWFRM